MSKMRTTKHNENTDIELETAFYLYLKRFYQFYNTFQTEKPKDHALFKTLLFLKTPASKSQTQIPN